MEDRKTIKVGNEASFWENELMPLSKILKIEGNKIQISYQGWGNIDEIKHKKQRTT